MSIVSHSSKPPFGSCGAASVVTLGTYDKDEEKDCILVTLPFAPGELKATGVGVHQRISDTLHSTGSPCQMSAEVYQPEKDTPAENLTYVSELTNGRNLYQIAITLLDSNGHRSYQASSMLQVQVVGGRLLGLENGDLADVTEYTANYRRAYHGELIAYVQADSDIPAVVTISGEMLKTLAVTVPANN